MESERESLDAHAAIASAAQRLLTGELGVIDAARKISQHRHTVDPDMEDGELLGFLAIDSQSDHLAVGPVLDEWHPSLRDAKRKEVADFEDFYREGALRDAAILFERYSRRT